MRKPRPSSIEQFQNLARSLADAETATPAQCRELLKAEQVDVSKLEADTLTLVEAFRKRQRLQQARSERQRVEAAIQEARARLQSAGGSLRSALNSAFGAKWPQQVAVMFHKLEHVSDADLERLHDNELTLLLWESIEPESGPQSGP